MSYIDVKFRVDGMNVLRDDCDCKMPYGEEQYPTEYGYSVLIDISTDDMIKVLEAKGYEVWLSSMMTKINVEKALERINQTSTEDLVDKLCNKN